MTQSLEERIAERANLTGQLNAAMKELGVDTNFRQGMPSGEYVDTLYRALLALAKSLSKS